LKVKREKQKQIKDLLAKLSSYKQARILIFDRIQDPHNLGACIRTAAAFGINDIIISEYASCKITDTVTHVSCGGSELVNVYYTKNLRSTIKKLHEHDVMVVATHISATDSYLDLKYADKTALIVSNENTGIDDKLLVHIKNQVKIELTNPLINSLNVSVAMAVIVSNPNFHRL
jgi:23S rRNA (guanosine2251-2'-O)-methyltransferase